MNTPKRFKGVLVGLAAGLALLMGAAGVPAATYAPGQFITLEDASIAAGTSYPVSFAWGSGPTQSLEIQAMEDGKLFVCLPPHGSAGGAGFSAGPVELTWPGGTLSLQMSDLPELEGSDPAAFWAHVMEWELTQHQALLAELQKAPSDSSLDAAISALGDVIAREQSQVDEIKATGQLTLTGDGPPVVLDGALLAQAARLDYAFIQGLAQALGYSASSASSRMGPRQGTAQERWEAFRDYVRDHQLRETYSKANLHLAICISTQSVTGKAFLDSHSMTAPVTKIIANNLGRYFSAMRGYIQDGQLSASQLAMMKDAITRVENAVGFLGMLGLTTNEQDNDDLAIYVRYMNRYTDHLSAWTEQLSAPPVSNAIYYYYDNNGARVGSQDGDAPAIDGSGAWVRVHGGPPAPSFTCLNLTVHQLKVLNLDTGMLTYNANAAWDSSAPIHYQAFAQPITYGDYSIPGLYIGDDWHYPNPSPDMQSGGVRYHVQCTDRGNFSSAAAVIGFP